MEIQARVVGKGMRWTPETADRFRQRHLYIKVGETSSSLTLTGAPARWKNSASASEIYLPDVRVVGSPDNVRTVLHTAGYDPQQIEQFVTNAYTVSNYNVPAAQGGKAEQYADEVVRYREYKKTQTNQQATEPGPTVTLNQLDYLVSTLPQAVTTKLGTKTKATPAAKAPKRRTVGVGGRFGSLFERLQGLQPGKVLDVSNMKETGANIKTIPTPSDKSSKVGVEGLSIVSSNYENYARAIAMLPPEYSKYSSSYPQKGSQSFVPAPVAPVVPAVPKGPVVPLVPKVPVVPAVQPVIAPQRNITLPRPPAPIPPVAKVAPVKRAPMVGSPR